MTTKKLGRGLQALLGGVEGESTISAVHASESDPPGELRQVLLTDIDVNPYQPRRDFNAEEISELAQSIQNHGVIQPIVVRPLGDRFQIVAGERRFRAATEAGQQTIPARVVPLDDQKTYEVALVENLQRRDLNAIEKAQAFDSYLHQFGTTHEALAAHLGVDRSTVTNLIRLLELPEPVQGAVRAGQISNGHARALLALNDSVEQIGLCRKIIAESLSVRQTEELVRNAKPATPKPPAAPKAPNKSNHVLSLENDLRQSLGTKVEIRANDQNQGTLVIHFQSNDDFERILDRILNKEA